LDSAPASSSTAATEQPGGEGRPDSAARRDEAGGRRAPYPDGLTPREAEVLGLIAGGHTNREIAAALVVSLSTVEHHIANLYAKISARNRADATAYALRHHLVPAPR
jgi:DNA-binding NarL/FixJ family response regulator